MRPIMLLLLVIPGVAAASPAPSELADLADHWRGPFSCSGTSAGAELQGTRTQTLELDRWWIRTAAVDRVGKDVLESAEFVSYDAVAKRWQRIVIDNAGASEVTTSTGATDHDLVTVFTGERGGTKLRHTQRKLRADRDPDGTVRVKDYEVSDETSRDGKTWTTTRELHCKTNRDTNVSAITDVLWTQTPTRNSCDLRLLVRTGGKPLTGEQDTDVDGRFKLTVSTHGHFAYGSKFDTNPNGRYVFNGMMPDTYSITIEDSKHEYKPVTKANLVCDANHAVTVDVDLTR
jgi:hypothetical protein